MSIALSKRWLPLALLAVYTGLSLGAMIKSAPTWDETHYLGLGVVLLKEGRWDVPSATLHPPLPYYLHSLPLLFCDLQFSCIETGESADILSGIRRGRCLLENSVPSGDSLLLLARLPMLFLGILLGWFVHRWASELHGTGGGFISLFLYCLSPNILAHSGLITPDLCLTAFGFLSVYFFWRNTRSPSAVRILLGGVTLGLTLMSKHAGVVFVPILLVLAVPERVRPSSSIGREKGFLGRGPIVHAGAMIVLAFFVLALGYRFDLAPYFSGIEAQRQMVGEGFPAFLNGEVSKSGGWWYYYLFAFWIKEPVPAMILLLAALFVAGRTGSRESGTRWLLAPVVVIFAAFSLFPKVNVGLRYVLPAFPFLMVLAGKALQVLRGKRSRAIALGCLLVWYAGENVRVYPHYLAYFNSLAGGPKNGYRRLVDSNLDWGQDLRGLRPYMDGKGIPEIKLSYFGTADPAWYGIRYEPLPSLVLPVSPGHQTCRELKQGDWVAVSATNLYPLYVDMGPLSEYLRQETPVGQVGYSILIYRMKRDIHVGP
jgi:4-amino-4-deoxy-L-arabinose transferase-like glycosyltransferase